MTNNKEKAYLFRIKFSLYSPIELDREIVAIHTTTWISFI